MTKRSFALRGVAGFAISIGSTALLEAVDAELVACGALPERQHRDAERNRILGESA